MTIAVAPAGRAMTRPVAFWSGGEAAAIAPSRSDLEPALELQVGVIARPVTTHWRFVGCLPYPLNRRLRRFAAGKNRTDSRGVFKDLIAELSRNRRTDDEGRGQ